MEAHASKDPRRKFGLQAGIAGGERYTEAGRHCVQEHLDAMAIDRLTAREFAARARVETNRAVLRVDVDLGYVRIAHR